MFLRYTTEDENVGQVANLSYAQAIFYGGIYNELPDFG